MNNPLNTSSPAWDRWTGYYEDVPKDTENVNDMTSMMTAYYILSYDDPSTADPEWQAHVGLPVGSEPRTAGPRAILWGLGHRRAATPTREHSLHKCSRLLLAGGVKLQDVSVGSHQRHVL